MRTRDTLRTETFDFGVDTWPLYAWPASTFIRTTPISVSWKMLRIVNLSVWGTTNRGPHSKILFSIVSSSLRRWYGRNPSNGHFYGQYLSTKFRTLKKLGSLRVAILHCLKSIGVDSIRETWTGCTLNSSSRDDSVLDRDRHQRASTFEFSHLLKYLTL